MLNVSSKKHAQYTPNLYEKIQLIFAADFSSLVHSKDLPEYQNKTQLIATSTFVLKEEIPKKNSFLFLYYFIDIF